MHGKDHVPTVVRLHDDVTGALSVVTIEEVSTVLDVWFPHLTAEGRRALTAFRDRLEAEDWRRVDELADTLGLRVERLDPPSLLPKQRRSAEDWSGTT